MRVWTEAEFRTASSGCPEAEEAVVWLPNAVEGERPFRFSGLLDALDRAGTRAGRLSTLIALGCVVCSAAPNSALAPVGAAQAAIERFPLHPAYPALLDRVSAPVEIQLEVPEPLGPGGGMPVLGTSATADDSAVTAPSNATALAGVGISEPARAPLQEPAQAIPAAAAEPVTLPNLALPRHATVGAASVAIAHVAPELQPADHEMRLPSFEEGRDEVEEFLRFGSRGVPRRLVETVVKAALATQVDPIYLMALADKESSFRIEVKASTSSAQGLFQFIDRTWLDVVRTFGPRHGLAAEAALIETVDNRITVADEAERTRILALRRDPYLSAVMAAEMLRRDAAQIGFRIGRGLTPTEMYLAHFLGLQDAARFIALRETKRGQSATAAFPAAARANVGIFFERGRRGRRKGLSVPEVYAKIDRMIDTRLTMFRPVMEFADGDAGS
ncbi:MAG: lytic transglycosylase catalytic [Enterovirga sp.]|nr:lytic transglycosylase catalytic [Enterovirga sp.]